MIALRICIGGHNVHIAVPRIPILCNAVPDPDQVLQLMHSRQAIEYNLVEFLRGLGAFSAPPEPLPFRFMEGTEEHWHAVVLQLLELHGNGIDILD